MASGPWDSLFHFLGLSFLIWEIKGTGGVYETLEQGDLRASSESLETGG